MNKLYSFIIILTFIIIGCTPKVIEKEKLSKKIDTLDLNIYSKSGIKKYSITSPYSIYDGINDKFQFKSINFYKETDPNICKSGLTYYLNNYQIPKIIQKKQGIFEKFFNYFCK